MPKNSTEPPPKHVPVIPQDPPFRQRRDLWEAAFSQLDKTEKAYEEYKKGGLKIKRGEAREDIKVRDVAYKVLSAALSFKDIVSAAASFDPTGHGKKSFDLKKNKAVANRK